MKFLFYILSVFAGLCFAAEAVSLSCKDAIKKSEKDGKPVLVEFYASWCIPCIEMEKTVFKDPEVLKELKNNFHFVRLDTDKNQEIFCEGETLSLSDCMMLWELEGIPAFAILDKEGNLKHISVGDYKKKEFLNFLRAVKKDR